MNEELQEKIVSWMEGVENFTSTEIPEFVTEILWWYGITSFISWVTLILCFIIGFMIFRHGLKRFKEGAKSDTKNFWCDIGWFRPEPSISGICMFTLSGCMVFVGFVGFFVEHDWLQILVTPKLFLLEYTTDLLASKG